MGNGILIRRATSGDRERVLRLLAATLGWLPDEQHAELFHWKHDCNPFGQSPAWVAIDEASGATVGFRTFLRWEFERGDEILRTVRAVDTATDPRYQGKGIFRDLTLQALDELRDEGVAFVFNTPNAQSRPGYLKMGWKALGRVPLVVRPRSLPALVRLARARVPAELWSVSTNAGIPAQTAIEHAARFRRPADGRLRTRLDPNVLRWRYAQFERLHYRAIVDADDGTAAIFRLRRRGEALEAAVTEVFGDGQRSSAARRVPSASGADYAVAAAPLPGAGYLPLPRQGPILTWRALADEQAPTMSDFHLSLGDIELF